MITITIAFLISLLLTALQKARESAAKMKRQINLIHSFRAEAVGIKTIRNKMHDSILTLSFGLILMLKPVCKRLLLMATLWMAILGCSAEVSTFPVEGMVTFKGKAIPKGEIYFDPDSSIKGPQGKALIREGKFSTKEFNSGVVTGKYIIRIQGFDGKPREDSPMGKAIFPAYELPMELIAGKPITIEVPSK